MLVKDGALLSDAVTSLEGCMYEYLKTNKRSCRISFECDYDTRFLQSQSFDYLAKQFSFVSSIDYLPVFYNDGYFTPISNDGEYLMFDRHHLKKKALLRLVQFFQENLN